MGSIFFKVMQYFSAILAFFKLLPVLVKSTYELYKFVDTFGDDRKEAAHEIKDGIKEARLFEDTTRLANILSVDPSHQTVVYEQVASDFDISIGPIEKTPIFHSVTPQPVITIEDGKMKYVPPVEPQDHVEDVVIEPETPPMEFKILGIGSRSSSVVVGATFLYQTQLGGAVRMGSQFIAPIFLFFCLGCSSNPVVDVDQYKTNTYKHDLYVKINGQECWGTCVVPRRTKYEIEIISWGKIDRAQLTSCAQEQVIDKPKGGNVFKTTFVQSELEDKACGLDIVVLEEKKVRNGFAFIDFQDARPEMNLVADMICNGQKVRYTSTGICQSAAGLRQKIVFPFETKLGDISSECALEPSKDGMSYEFPMPRGKCTYYFVSNVRNELNGKRISMRLQTIGYSILPVRTE